MSEANRLLEKHLFPSVDFNTCALFCMYVGSWHTEIGY